MTGESHFGTCRGQVFGVMRVLCLSPESLARRSSVPHSSLHAVAGFRNAQHVKHLHTEVEILSDCISLSLYFGKRNHACPQIVNITFLRALT